MISVIVPVYNVQQYLERCLDSILRQTYDNLEIILVDDGSTDSSGRICDNYKEKDSRIFVIHKENGGLSDARNAGIEAATGDYIAFVDSDDWIDDDMYEVLYQILQENDADIAECSYRNVFVDHIEEETSNTGECLKADKLFALENQLAWINFRSIVWNKIFKKNIFKNLRFPIGKFHEDEFIIYKAFYLAEKLVSIDISKYNYIREREGSITVEFREKNIDKCEAMKERLEFICSKEELYPLKNKMLDAYYWVIFDVLHNCYINHIQSNRVDKLLLELRQDYWKIIKSNVSRRFKVELTTLMISYKLFMMFRQLYLLKNRKV